MSQEYNILNLCESCIAALHKTIEANTGKETSVMLKQKLFLLETALEDFKDNHTDFEEICNRFTDALYVVDQNGKTIYVNRPYLSLTGLKKEDLLGKTLTVLKNEKQFYQNPVLPIVLSTGKHTELIDTILSSNRQVFLSGIPVFDPSGALKYALCQGRILTDEETCQVTKGLLPSQKADAMAEVEPFTAASIDYNHIAVNNLKQTVETFEKGIIIKTVKEKGSKRKAATALGMDHSTLIKKCQRYGI